jgi:hypothetical protein
VIGAAGLQLDERRRVVRKDLLPLRIEGGLEAKVFKVDGDLGDVVQRAAGSSIVSPYR